MKKITLLLVCFFTQVGLYAMETAKADQESEEKKYYPSRKTEYIINIYHKCITQVPSAFDVDKKYFQSQASNIFSNSYPVHMQSILNLTEKHSCTIDQHIEHKERGWAGLWINVFDNRYPKYKACLVFDEPEDCIEQPREGSEEDEKENSIDSSHPNPLNELEIALIERSRFPCGKKYKEISALNSFVAYYPGKIAYRIPTLKFCGLAFVGSVGVHLAQKYNIHSHAFAWLKSLRQ